MPLPSLGTRGAYRRRDRSDVGRASVLALLVTLSLYPVVTLRYFCALRASLPEKHMLTPGGTWIDRRRINKLMGRLPS